MDSDVVGIIHKFMTIMETNMTNRIPTCLGSGVFNLDTVVVREYPEGYQKQRTFNEKVMAEEVGGTCGNVMSMLPYLGVQTFPLAILDQTEQGIKIKDTLALYGADTRFVSNTEKGGTTLLRCTHRRDADGNKVVKFRATSPGSMFAKRRQLSTKSGEVDEFLGRLDFVPDVFFFDDPAAAHVKIAQALRQKGTLVYFEPEGLKDGKVKPFLERVRCADVVKFSAEKISDESWIEQFTDKLFIRTMGEKGVAFKLRGGDWTLVPPVTNDNVVDWEGAGDWTTSAFIAELCKGGHLDFSGLNEDIVRSALEEAQKIASKSVSFLSSKGMIHKELK